MAITGNDSRVLETFRLVQSSQYHEMIALVEELRDEELDSSHQNIIFMYNNYLIALLKTEQHEKGARVADLLQELAPRNPHIYHNAACLYCFVGQLDKALEQVKLAREHGGMELIRLLENDEDLRPIASHPDFVAIVGGRQPTQEKDDKPKPTGGTAPLPY